MSIANNPKQKIINTYEKNFVGFCDDTAFGIINQMAIDTFNPGSVTNDFKVKWAILNAEFYKELSEKLLAYAQYVKEEKVPDIK